jgi:hypothetical protein
MEQLLALIKKIDLRTRKSRLRWKQVGLRLDDWQASLQRIQQTQASMLTTQDVILQSIAALQEASTAQRSQIEDLQSHSVAQGQVILGLRGDLDQAQAADEELGSSLGRVAGALNTFVDGYEIRFEQIEQRLDKLEKSA